MASAETSKFVAIGGILIIVALAVNHWLAPTRTTRSVASLASDRLPIPSVGSAPVSRADESKHGLFIASTDRATEFTIAGWSFCVSPVHGIAYYKHVNGERWERIENDGRVSWTKGSLPRHITTVGYQVVSGQGHDEVTFAYVKYVGDTPPAGWYGRALRSGER